MKKFLSMVLAVVLLLSAVPMSVFASSDDDVTVSSVVIDPVESIYGYNGYFTEETLENGKKDKYFVYNSYPNSVTITMSNGDEYTDLNDFANETGLCWGCQEKDNQTSTNRWETGKTYYVDFSISNDDGTLGTYTYTVTTLQNPVEWVSISDLEIVENTNGYMNGYYDADDTYISDAYFHYFNSDFSEQTVTLKLRAQDDPLTGTANEIQEATGYSFSTSDDQTYTNQWGVGTHKAAFSVLGVETEYNVVIKKSPVKKITVTVSDKIEKCDGSWQSSYYDVDDEWFYYDIYPEKITVETTNGQTVTGTPYEVEEILGDGMFFESDQSYEKQWGVGTHKAKVSYLGKTVEYNVKVVKSPIKKITVSPMTLEEKYDGSYTSYTDKNGKSDYWFRYDYGFSFNDKITVEYQNGTKITGTLYEIYEATNNLSAFSFSDDQSYSNQWGVGKHKVKFSFMGYTGEVEVTVAATSIESITVDSVEIIENTEGEYDEENECYIYNDFEPEFTVKLKSGGTLKSENGSVKINGEFRWLTILSDTSEQVENPWIVGKKYSVDVALGGFKTTVDVEIAENPVESISVDTFDITQFTNGYSNYDFDTETERWIYEYEYCNIPFVVNLKNGGKINSKKGSIGHFVEIKGKNYKLQFEDDTQYETPWDVGEHKVKATLCGVKCDVAINITPTPIKSIKVDDIVITQELDSYGDWYSYYPESYTITTTDGFEFKNNGKSYVTINGDRYYPELSDTQNDEEWEPGKTYIAKLKIGNIEGSFKVKVKESPIKSVQLLRPATKTVYKIGESINVRGAVIRICYKDNTYEDFAFDKETLLGGAWEFYSEKCDANIYAYAYDEVVSEIGTHTVTIEVLGRELTFDVKCVANDMESFNISKNGDGSLDVTIDGKKYEILNLNADYDDYESEGYIKLSDGDKVYEYTSKIIFNSQDEQKIVIYLDSSGDKKLTSNALDLRDWLKVMKTANNVRESIFNRGSMVNSDFEGTVTKQNIDAIMSFTYFSSYSDIMKNKPETFVDEDDEKVIIDAQKFEEYIKDNFDVKSVDFTLSDNYNSDKGQYTLFLGSTVSNTCLLEKVYIKDGEWHFKILANAENTIDFTLSSDCKIAKYGNCEHIYTDSTDTVCNKCGHVRVIIKDGSGKKLVTEADGKVWYYKDGIRSFETLFYSQNGSEYYIENGVCDKKLTTLVKYKNCYRYVKNGVFTKYTGFVKYNGKYYYLKNGVTGSYTGFYKSGSKYYYVKDSVRSTSTGFVKYNGKYYYLKSGAKTDVTGFYKSGSNYYYVKNGIRSTTTGFVKQSGNYYKLKNGARVSADAYIKYKSVYLKLSETEYNYNGKTKTPKVSICDSKGNALSSKYYSVKYSSGRKNVGKYTVTVTLKKKYSGSKKLYFTINPASTSLKNLTAAKKSLKVTINKKSGQTTGYQIQYSTSKSFKDAKTKTVSSYKTTSVTIKGLSAKKTYYVRVRTYKTVNGKKYYSSWSSAKSKKTK